ncbi:MAG TPA: S16 family serine protease [Ornithinibacter sp.]|nr:S16 family serine protease [Ornithinibacter sp.]
MTTPSHDVLGDGTSGPGTPGGPHDPAHVTGGVTPRGVGRPGALPAVLLTATFVAIALAAALTFVGLPYVVMSPGPATNILGEVDGKPVLSVDGASTYPTAGTLDFTTVSVEGGPGVKVTVYDLGRAWLSQAEEVLPEEQVFPPDADEEQVQEEGAAEMAGSQSVATATALRALGRDVPELVVIAAVPDGSPSAGVFEPGDVLVSVDGVPAASADAVRAAVQEHGPGESIPVVVRRDGAERTVTARTAEADGRTVIGVSLRLDYDLPVDVTINTGSVGGPSAGLMFSLAIYDVLTPGELNGGKDVAGTGTLEDDGSVGPIGGIRQKVVGAREAGAEFFLAPAENCAELEGAVPDGLEVLRVASFDEGLASVEAIASGDTASLPTCG